MREEQSGPPLQREDINKIIKGVAPQIASLLRVAHEQRFRVNKTNGGHVRVRTPEHWQNQQVAFCPATPSEYRATENTRRKLKHIGVKFRRQ